MNSPIYFLCMKKLILLFFTLLISIVSFAENSVLVTAGDKAAYSAGDALIVNGLSAEELGINGEITLTVYWDGTGGAAAGYAAMLSHNGGAIGFCDEGLMVSKNADAIITITGTMSGSSSQTYSIDVQVGPKQPSTIHLEGVIQETIADRFEPTDLVISARAAGYSFSITLFKGLSKKYGEYKANSIFVTINGDVADLKENTTLNYYQEGELAVIEATFVSDIDTLVVTLSGAPYVAPEDVMPTDTLSYTLYGATVGKSSGFNTVMGKNDEIELKIQVPNGDWLEGVTHESFSYGSYLKVGSEKLTIIRGNLKVVQDGNMKTATIGVLASNHVWYNITATTATAESTNLENIYDEDRQSKKYLKEGQLIIYCNGVEYNTQGYKL